MTRQIKDSLKQVTAALPAANAAADLTPFDLEQAVGGALENVEIEIAVPALTELVHNKKLTFSLKHGDSAGSLAAMNPQITCTAAGKSGNGLDAVSFRFRLPANAKRYVAINAAVENGGGDNTAKSITASLLF